MVMIKDSKAYNFIVFFMEKIRNNCVFKESIKFQGNVLPPITRQIKSEVSEPCQQQMRQVRETFYISSGDGKFKGLLFNSYCWQT